jgi:hypothetical protein
VKREKGKYVAGFVELHSCVCSFFQSKIGLIWLLCRSSCKSQCKEKGQLHTK